VGSDGTTVRFEPCDIFMAGADPTAAACSACGWFEEDHWFAELERPGVRGVPGNPVKEAALTGTA
jgi:hypothetical protein